MTHTKVPEISFVVPVYNGAGSIGEVVRQIINAYPGMEIEVVLVNDGSADDSEAVCRKLVDQHPLQVSFVQLMKNFGEHSAVLAGLSRTRGEFVAVLDDDGQNPPAEVRKLYDLCRSRELDVVYGFYEKKAHHWFRNLGSWLNDKAANIMVRKPPEIYLSSFKVMRRRLVDEIVRYKGPYPYIDGLIFRTTSRVGQTQVKHVQRQSGQSGYTLRKLVRLWLNMFVNHSMLPLRIASILGAVTAGLSALMILAILVEKLATPNYPIGIPSILVSILFFAGVQLIILGVVGEYLGRLFLDHNGVPQYVVRYQLGATTHDAA